MDFLLIYANNRGIINLDICNIIFKLYFLAGVDLP